MRSSQSIFLLSSPPYAFFLSCSLVMILLTTTHVCDSYVENETDHLALLSFKSMITRDPYGVLSSWNSSLHFCDWSGVSCGKHRKRVSHVLLSSQGLEGYLSPHIGNLSFLLELSLSNNSFQGTIPHDLCHLNRLRFLYLNKNKLIGVIPTNMSGFSNLEELSLSYNKIVGNIPKEIGFLSKLTIILLRYNNLTGGIPCFMGNITSMEVFSFAGNPLGGSIPNNLGHLSSLKVFAGGDCNLYGTIPHSIYNLTFLSNLSLSDNDLIGSLPPALGVMLPNLVFLQLRNNQLNGLLPSSISNCSKIRILDMGDNNFSGKLTINFEKLREISEILLSDNLFGLGEADEMLFIDSLKNCSRMKILALCYCNFQGFVPISIGNISAQLQLMSIQGNKLYGHFPSSIGNLVGLNTLVLDENWFEGNIPSTIGKLQKLELFSVSENQFSGLIPDAIGNLSSLIYVYLDSNKLEGHIPASLGNCSLLLEIDLSDNKFSGKVPKQLLQLSSLSIILNLSQNCLSGSLPTEVGDLKMLAQLDLSYNNLSGNIPNSLGGCTSLSLLYIYYNFFQGTIPPSLSSLRGLIELDLSHNNLSGQIPLFLETFSLEYLNISYNDFEGEVPMLGVFANASAFSTLGNSRICGSLVELGLPKCKKKRKHATKRVPLFIAAILISSVVILILCFVYAWCKKRRERHLSLSWRWNEQFLQVSYNQLLKATDGFSEVNLIGHGGFSSVYKGILEHEDTLIAIKVFHLRNRQVERSFIRECEAWRGIRHRNLLKILTSCSSVDFQGNDFKALVYEFMPNGNLHDWLHSVACTSRLNLLQRINILIDVAFALDYLHNRCQTTIIHCDLKPSNILLDEDMVAHVGDFGLARFFGIDSNKNSSTGVKGTIGYTPPEYGMGNEMTSSGDVYSYGILLLELMTGKKPTDNIFNEGLSLHKCVSMALLDHVTNVIDGEAIVMHVANENAIKMEECLASIVKIGVSCTVDSPRERMNIENVLHELMHIKDAL